MTMAQERIALVTGAASGIGLATAELLLKRGMVLVLTDRSEEVSTIASQLVSRIGGRASAIRAELSKEEGVLQLAVDVIKQHGRVDVLVNNAGIHPKKNGDKFYLEDISAQHWASVMAVNLTAPFLLSRELIPQMKARRWGRVVNVSSCAARTAFRKTSAAYVASKHGLIGLTHTCAAECASDGVTVNAVAPGPIQTGLTQAYTTEQRQASAQSIPMGRYGEPMEVAAMIDFLGSDAASFVTGAVFAVHGGSVIV